MHVISIRQVSSDAATMQRSKCGHAAQGPWGPAQAVTFLRRRRFSCCCCAAAAAAVVAADAAV